MNSTIPKTAPLMIWWVIWIALLGGVIVLSFVLGDSSRTGEADSLFPVAFAAVAAFATSVVIRWVLLPRLQKPAPAFALFIVGLSLAEMAAILGMLVIPENKTELVGLGILGMLQFAPFFAARYFQPPREQFSLRQE
jgi:glucan phosphoethanolaminetransferase (alkaline phosphatase superfamily)